MANGNEKPIESGEETLTIKPMTFKELPPEFLRCDKPLGLELHHFNIIWVGILTHFPMAYALLYLIPFGHVSWGIFLFATFYGYLTGLAINVGSHRYWTHKTYKANFPLQIFLMLMHTGAMQHPLFKWCRDHRAHHKYMDTNADPHNAAVGFWFSHITWLFHPRHPDLTKGLQTVDISDLVRDPIVRFQAKYYWELLLVVFFIIPLGIFYLIDPEMSFFDMMVINQARYGISLHFTFVVNSIAHIWGDKPYDKYISPTENRLVAVLAAGEGWHNYHHAFPWDYKAAEFGFKLNVSAIIIRFFAMAGWAYDLKTVSHKLLVARINRTGDGSHPFHRDNNNNNEMTEDDHDKEAPPSWGWGDKDVKMEDVKITEISYPAKSR